MLGLWREKTPLCLCNSSAAITKKNLAREGLCFNREELGQELERAQILGASFKPWIKLRVKCKHPPPPLSSYVSPSIKHVTVSTSLTGVFFIHN